ncbi:MAG: hypothetical protein QHH17_02815, partial [Candidatus Bathyarchaeota archaeon]|nr:hypothetical protein [Candidatus Bathyarchaeota archaeon]
SEEKGVIKESGKFDLNSKFWRTLLLVLAALLTFGGPYVVYVLNIVLEIDLAVSMVSGFALFMVGLVLIWRLIKRGVIS